MSAPRTCTVRVTPSPVQCGRPATVEIIVGCVHEHLSTEASCDEHRHVVMDWGPWECRACREAPDGRGHACFAHIAERDLVTP